MVWPHPRVLARIKNQKPNLKFILQISPHLDDYNDMAIGQISERLADDYRGLADYVIVDFSRGLGKELAVGQTMAYLEGISKMNPEIGLSTGGGLHAGNLLIKIGSLLPRYPQLSFDAQGQLRDNLMSGGGTLCIPRAQNFLSTGFTMTAPHNL
jgi:hypothetical protein